MAHWIIAAAKPPREQTAIRSSPCSTSSRRPLALHHAHARLLLVALWLACAYWVFKDARRRIDDKIVLAVCVLTGLVFGPVGLIVYAIVRPPVTLTTGGSASSRWR